MKFLIFFILVFCIYHLFSNKLKFQNIILVTSSTLFYSWFEWKYTLLIWGYIFVNYFSGISIQKSTVSNKKRFIFICAITFNLGILAIFKYYNFFSQSIIDTLNSLGVTAHPFTIEVILPVGISFYCFQCISYVSDVYQKVTKAEEDLIIFSAFILFFPQLVAGPIQRANNFIPQFHKPRNVSSEDINLGLWAIIWGVFNKVVIADTCIELSGVAFSSDSQNQGLILGTLAYGIGIYADFNGYSLMAIGTAKLLGFNIIWNFIHPYGAKSIIEFWERWHISLSQWLKDYLYHPTCLLLTRYAAINNYGPISILIITVLLPIMFTFFWAGVWHGSTLNCVVFGVYHGILLSFCQIWRKVFKRIKFPQWLGWTITQITVFFGWYLFAVSANDWSIKFFEPELIYDELTKRILILTGLFSMILFIIGRLQIRTNDMYAPARLRLAPYSILLASLFLAIFAKYTSAIPKFIYFQF
jgi:alginate O-acetyltransferase complex protein AlgI